MGGELRCSPRVEPASEWCYSRLRPELRVMRTSRPKGSASAVPARGTQPHHLAAGRSALRAWPLQTSRSSLGGRSQRRPALVAGNRPPKPDHSISAPNPTQHGTMRRSGSTKTGNELGAARSNMSEPYMPTCTTNPAVPAMTKQPTPCKTASGRHAIRPDEGAIGRTTGQKGSGAVLARRAKCFGGRTLLLSGVSCELSGRGCVFCTTLRPAGENERALSQR